MITFYSIRFEEIRCSNATFRWSTSNIQQRVFFCANIGIKQNMPSSDTTSWCQKPWSWMSPYHWLNSPSHSNRPHLEWTCFGFYLNELFFHWTEANFPLNVRKVLKKKSLQDRLQISKESNGLIWNPPSMKWWNLKCADILQWNKFYWNDWWFICEW